MIVEGIEDSAEMVGVFSSQLVLPKTAAKLSDRDKLRRIEFCVHNQDLRWESVIFSDELMIEINTKGFAWWPKLSNGCLGETNRREVDWIDKKQLVVWGGITANKILDLVVIKKPWNHSKYIHYVLESQLKPLVKNCPSLVFQHDNSPVHRAKNVTEWFMKKNINCLNWPSKSWDLNIMEDVWGILKEEMGELNHTTVIENEMLEKNIIDAWSRIQKKQDELLPILYGSMNSRLHSCIANNGDFS